MSEEEKKAIEFIKYYMREYFCEEIAIQDDFDFEDSIKIILNLITKQQNEIEIHKDNFEGLSADITQILKDLGLSEETIIADEMVEEINKKYINKDIIRKIKENTDTRYDFTEEVLKLL